MINVKTISLVLTQKCNLTCIYCYERFRVNASMPFIIAKESLQRHLSDSNYEEFVIDFFGGEPFLEFNLMRKIFDFVETLNLDRPYHFSTTTNGTLVHGAVQDWLISKRGKCHITLSLDGTKEMHDHNRSNSYSMIDFPFFKKYYENQPVKMTLSHATLPHLAAGVKHIHSLGFKIENNLAYGLDWSVLKNIIILQRELKNLIDYYLDNPNIVPCRLLSMEIAAILPNNNIKKWCGVGTNIVTTDIDGRDYPCHAFLPISLGTEKARKYQHFNFNEIRKLLDEPCVACAILPICPTCYGANLYKNENPKLRDKNLCNLAKITALACSYFEAQKIIHSQKNKRYSKYMIEAILKIQKEINIGDSALFQANL